MLPIEQRDALLLLLQEKVFGNEPKAVADCPQCGEHLELTLNILSMIDRSRDIYGDISPLLQEVTIGIYKFLIRNPDSRDIAEASKTRTQYAARARLIELCIKKAEKEGSTIAVSEIPEEVVSQMADKMEETNSQGENLLNIQCPSCKHSWHSAFDIGSFLYAEIAAVAKRILKDVHELASSYGWSERDILAMSPERRQFYLEKIG